MIISELSYWEIVSEASDTLGSAYSFEGFAWATQNGQSFSIPFLKSNESDEIFKTLFGPHVALAISRPNVNIDVDGRSLSAMASAYDEGLFTSVFTLISVHS
ncbi:MAG: hypothetical protein JOZ78_13255 [Chroococcidiopsidaceae cyanobacterium CP_BM_ER_R8_30]|nr:hypothetical protein [Chroococcidiopsidaceae cyanobacterium CP_BM_ER_R8_30]